MARTVDSPPQLATVDAISATEISAEPVEAALVALNSCYEQSRGSILVDTAPDVAGEQIMLAQSGIGTNPSPPIMRYRCRILGRGGLSSELVRAWLRVEVTPAGAGPYNAAIRITDGTNSTTWQDLTGTVALGWVDAGTFALADSGEYADLEIEILFFADVNIWVFGAAVYYERAKTALDAVPIGALSYTNDVVPLDLDYVTGERPLSAARLQNAHDLAIYLYEQRVGQIVTATYLGELEDTDPAFRFLQATPTSIGSNEITARFFAYLSEPAGLPATTVCRLTISTSYGTAGSLLVTPFVDQWVGPLDITIPAPDFDQALTEFSVTGDNVDVLSFCGWWRDVSY